MKLLYVASFAACVLLWSCQTGGYAPDTTVAVGTFNIEWLGDGVDDQKPRTDPDYLLIADVIARMNVDVLGVQEIENEQALQRVLRYLDGYTGFVANGGTKQNVGVIHRKTVDVRNVGLYQPLTIGKKGMRPGLIVECKKGSFDWIMMVVHLKSTSRYDSTNALREESRQIRSAQVELLSAWSDSVVAAGKEKDVMLVGDFNDATNKRQQATLTALMNNTTMQFVTGGMKSCRNPQWNTIDQVVVSKSAHDRFIKGSEYMEDLKGFLPAESVAAISDHCPVIVRFRTNAPDND